MCMKCFLECQKCVIKVSMYCECGWFMCDQVYCVWSGVLWVCKICMTKCTVCVQDVCVWSSVLCEKSLIILTMPSNFQGSYVVISQMWMLNSQQMEASSTSVSSYMSVCVAVVPRRLDTCYSSAPHTAEADCSECNQIRHQLTTSCQKLEKNVRSLKLTTTFSGVIRMEVCMLVLNNEKNMNRHLHDHTNI